MHSCVPIGLALSVMIAVIGRAVGRRCRTLGAGIALSVLATTAGADRAPLVFGVFPSLTPKVLIETYQPVVQDLKRRLDRPVVLYTAADFKQFVARTRRGEFDLLLTPPHLAWLARQDTGYRPLVKYASPVQGLLIVRTGSSVRSIAELKGKTIASANPLAVIAMAMEAQLRAHGLTPGTDLRIHNAQSHNNAVMLAFNGVTDAAIVGTQAYRQLPPNVRTGVRVIGRTPPLSSPMYMTHPRIRDAEATRIRDALLGFVASVQGRAFIKRGGFGGLVQPDGKELQLFKPYALEAQQRLKDVR